MHETTEGIGPQAEARGHLVALLRAGAAWRGEEAPLVDFVDAAKPVDDELVRLMMRHRVAAYLHPLLDAQPDPDALPVELSALCRQVYFAVLRRNAVTLDVGEALLAELSRVGIQAAARGPWAALRGEAPAYGDPGRRPIDGLVVSVPASARCQVRDVARGLGFDERRHQEANDARLWRRMGRLRLSLDICVAAQEEGPHRLLLDAVHSLVEGRFGRWIGLLDLHHLIDRSRQPTDWAGLREAAEAEGLARDLVRALRLARGLLGTRVPEGSVPAPRRLTGRRPRHLAHSSVYIGLNP